MCILVVDAGFVIICIIFILCFCTWSSFVSVIVFMVMFFF